MTRSAAEAGQVAVMSVLFMTALVGMTALVLDVGSWFREDRRLQATADAAALAGAQLLPDDPGRAVAEALAYAELNGGGVAAADVQVESRVSLNDTIRVRSSGIAPGFFSRLFGIFSVRVGGVAAARAAKIGKARWVAPIAVNERHPMLLCAPQPCFEQTTTIELANLNDPASSNASGSFGLLRLSKDPGSISTATIASWLREGYEGLLGPGSYPAATGAKYNSNDFHAALGERLGDEVLFPVYRSVTGTGANAAFDVIAWIGFVPEAFTGSGSTGTLTGRFTRLTWAGVESDAATTPDFGARTVLLVE